MKKFLITAFAGLCAFNLCAQSQFSRSLWNNGSPESWRKQLGITTNEYITTNNFAYFFSQLVIGSNGVSIINNGDTIIIDGSGSGGGSNFVSTNTFNNYTNYAETNFVTVGSVQTNSVLYFNNGAGNILNTVVTNRTTNVVFSQLQITLTQGASGSPTVNLFIETNANTGTYTAWGAYQHTGMPASSTLVISALNTPVNPGCRYYYSNQSSGASSASSTGWRVTELITR